MHEKKVTGVKISARVEGVGGADIPLKAVVYTEEKKKFKILAEKPIKEDQFDVELKIAPEDLPSKFGLVVVPQELKKEQQIRRLAGSGHAPNSIIHREMVLARKGILEAAALKFKPVDDMLILWPLTHQVCGRVIKRDPVTGEECPVPGATVRIMDVDIHAVWWHPWHGYPWGWIFPLLIGREEIATAVTDECGRFCVDIPYFDIDIILRWRLRFRCLWDILRVPRVIDAIRLGVKPDLRAYPELEPLPELEINPGPIPGPPPPVVPDIKTLKNITRTGKHSAFSAASGAFFQASQESEKGCEFCGKPEFEPVLRGLSSKQELFESVDPGEKSILEKPAFPKSVTPPALPDDETLLKILPDKEMLAEIHNVRPIVRLLLCWPEFIPEWHVFWDIPDIVFKVEQDIDGDGINEVIYDESFFDANWDLSNPTTDVVIEAWNNAVCVPCGPAYTPCTASGIVGINEMAVDPMYIDSSGYAKRVNRPNPSTTGIIPPLSPPIARPNDARTPFCRTLRLVGCPEYGAAASYYRVFYNYKGSETFFKESWYIYNIPATSTHHVVPDSQGFYPVLSPSFDFFPYNTLINWQTHNYPDGLYSVRMEIYDAGKNPVGPSLPEIKVQLDNSRPSPVEFKELWWREEGTAAWQPLPLFCPIIERPTGKNIELKVEYNVAASHLRDVNIHFSGCSGGVGSNRFWHRNVFDNNVTLTWEVKVLSSKAQGGYYFYLAGYSRAFNATGCLATDWYCDQLYIGKGNTLPVVILDA